MWYTKIERDKENNLSQTKKKGSGFVETLTKFTVRAFTEAQSHNKRMNNINENNINDLEDMKEVVGRVKELTKKHKELAKGVKKHEGVFLSQQEIRTKRNTDKFYITQRELFKLS